MKQEKDTIYQHAISYMEHLFKDEQDSICIMANLSALLYDLLPNVNWVGFYRLIHEELILGPFQGKVACMHIPIGKGVCGSCVQQKKTQIVNDVHACKNHIVCDINSKSEIVVPIFHNGAIYAVLDIDSNILSCFDEVDAYYLSKICEFVSNKL